MYQENLTANYIDSQSMDNNLSIKLQSKFFQEVIFFHTNSNLTIYSIIDINFYFSQSYAYSFLNNFLMFPLIFLYYH